MSCSNCVCRYLLLRPNPTKLHLQLFRIERSQPSFLKRSTAPFYFGMSDDLHPLTVASARELIRGANLRSTTCRVAVLQHLSRSAGPQSHSDVADVLVPEGFDKSTIYRCLVE